MKLAFLTVGYLVGILTSFRLMDTYVSGLTRFRRT